MALFDSLINEASQKFGLGDKAAPLLSALLALMTKDSTGGLAGFIDRFRQVGLGDLVTSWISTGANRPVTEGQVQEVLGADTIGNMASKSGLSTSIATSALAFLVPKVIDLLTPNGTVPSVLPQGLTSFMSGERVVREERVERTEGSGWLRWLPLLLLPLLILLGYQYCNRPTVDTPVAVATPTATVMVTPVPAVVRADLGAFIEKRLPNGIILRIPTNGVESKLLAFIEDPSKLVDKETWFSFDRIEFDTDSANLRPSSAEQLRNIHEILNAYPNVNLKIGGYTDNTGNDAYNLKLSGDRATNTMNEIVKLGVNKPRLAAEGYGKDHPVADNATEEGRQRNRRIDVRVTKK